MQGETYWRAARLRHLVILDSLANLLLLRGEFNQSTVVRCLARRRRSMRRVPATRPIAQRVLLAHPLCNVLSQTGVLFGKQRILVLPQRCLELARGFFKLQDGFVGRPCRLDQLILANGGRNAVPDLRWVGAGGRRSTVETSSTATGERCRRPRGGASLA